MTIKIESSAWHEELGDRRVEDKVTMGGLAISTLKLWATRWSTRLGIGVREEGRKDLFMGEEGKKKVQCKKHVTLACHISMETYGAPFNKFRDLKMYFSSSWS